MEIVHASEIWREVWSLFDGSDYDDTGMSAEDFANFRNWTGRRLKHAWQHHFWPDLVHIEHRYFRYLWPYEPLVDSNYEPILDGDGNFTLVLQSYPATSVAVPREVFYPPTRKYYQSLRSANDDPCANAAGVENSAWWAECAISYSADDWVTAHAYAVGDKARNLDDDRYYQCHTAHTSAAAIDFTKFTVLNPFLKYVPARQIAVSRHFIGTVIEVWDKNPELSAARLPVPFTLSNRGVQVTRELEAVYLEHRRRAPRLFGTQFSATVAYARKKQVFYTAADGFGDFWDVNITTTAGFTPDSQPDYFLRVEIPRNFQEYLTLSVFADALRNDGQFDKGADIEADADAALDRAVIELVGQSKQVRRTQIFTR